MGQQGVESKAGLTGEAPRDWLNPEDWSKSFKEVAPQTFLLTTLMAGAGTSIITTKNAYTKLKNSLVNELTSKGYSKEEATKLATGRVYQEPTSKRINTRTVPNC